MPSSSDQPTTDPFEALPELEQAPPSGLARLSRLNVALIVLSLLSLSAALYLSPMGESAQEAVSDKILDLSPPAAGATASPTAPTTSPSGSATPKASPSASALPAPIAPVSPGGYTAPAAATTTTAAEGKKKKKKKKTAASTSSTKTRTACWQFTWQQDAQAVYVANLSDPYGLDAGKGPYDGDGLACSDLPVDPSRPASTPVGAYSPPTPSVAAKARLVNPTDDYFGFAQDGIPGDTAMYDKLATAVGKAPSTVGWFSSWDESYRGDLVTRAWSRGALPVVTWMPVEAGSGNSYSLTSIINGSWDKYLRRYAGDVVRNNLPVAIRLMHEMNTGGYPWASGRSEWNNTPAKYVAAWRHIWEIFDEVGATADVIWLWAPNRVDNMKAGSNGASNAADSYPGDAYVDWVGASVYLRQSSTGATFDASFGKTLKALAAITDKPVFIAETAAIQTSTDGTDVSALKAQWTANLLSTVAARQDIVGLTWFNNPTSVDAGDPMDADWRFDSSSASLAAFRKGVSTSAFHGGVMPD
jgi:mannan endo-1,4-beta-mannosidase